MITASIGVQFVAIASARALRDELLLCAACARLQGDGIKINNAIEQGGCTDEFIELFTFFVLFDKSMCCTGAAQCSGDCDVQGLPQGHSLFCVEVSRCLLAALSQLHLQPSNCAQQVSTSVLANHVQQGLTFFLFNRVDCSSQRCRKILGIFYAFAVSAAGLYHLFKQRRRTQVGQ